MAGEDGSESEPDGAALGTAPTVDDGVGWQVAKQSIHQALFPDVGAEPSRVGRFELLRRLGRGGMGEVFVAYDDRLDRRVAIKLLLREHAANDHARERLLREAQVLARLSHPNVVQIHEAGIHEGQVYLVMELVDGITLREWMEQAPEGTKVRPWSEVVPVMIEAGRGLAAAHAQGLMHRDFKPDNVLVGNDGRVRVLDFGLARPGVDESASSSAVSVDDPTAVSMRAESVAGSGSRPGSGSGSRRGIVQLTEPGRVVGTLAYMSPEQLTATPLDARSDQYGFCVTLYEALYGERPFNGRSFAAYLMAVTQGRLEEPTTRSLVPRWLRAVVRRGLSVAPDDRFADMNALLRELSRPRGRGRRIAVVAGGLLLGGATVGSMLSSPEQPCAQADAELAAQWDDHARARVRTSFAAAEPSYGADAAERVIAALDGRVDAWRAEQRDACEDTRVRQTHPVDVLARRTACIERNTADLRALLHALPDADAGVVEHGLDMVEGLPQPVRCQDLDALGPQAPEDPEVVRATREALATARVTRRAGRDDEARAFADEARTRAEATGYGPVHAEALVESARVRLASPHQEDKDAALDMLWQALDLAELHEHRELSFEIWLELLSEDDSRGRHDRARLWARRAEIARQRNPGEPRRRLELAARRGVAELRAGEATASERILRQGLEAAETESSSELQRAQLLEALGNTLRRAGRTNDALEAYDQAEQLWRDALGPGHPYLARHDYNQGLLLTDLGHVDAARQRLERARTRWIELYGARTLLVGRSELALAQLDQLTGALDDALAHARRGQEILAVARDPDDPLQVEALQLLGLVQFRRGELQDAHDTWQQALEHIVAARGPDDSEALLTRSNMAEALLGLDEHERARRAYEALLPAVQARADQEPLTAMLVLKGLGLAELGTERAAEAVPRLEAALALLERHGGHPLEQADLLWALARAERATGEPREGVHARAERAAELYVEHGQSERADEIRTWLATFDR
ncbi:serine/threonine-protein kinase [Paraliomyxa miuraensis]|uniref:serine/threonine-protein kinase n=1 Tax=Paraliomyxa miuraensis TaxID=376150 RepID=UPI00224EB321|nr:serine/threonine-protein kinase [Paraliomyxa miuraensis]MCX4244019.1 serine/threonine-protein kinase [Paraliomyxa miuraensis]